MKLIIMCVDDEQGAIENLKYDLKKYEGIRSVVTFTNPIEALEYAKGNEVNVAFLDVSMPQMSGIELAKELIRVNPEIKYVFFSGELKYRDACYAAGGVGYILKPYMESQLEEILELLKGLIGKD